ncbi:MAG: Serine aminopeptidase [Planctomycetota bacterium]
MSTLGLTLGTTIGSMLGMTIGSTLSTTLGFATLLGAAALLVSGAYLRGLWNDAVRPARRSMGWALGQGLPASPEDLSLQSEERNTVLSDGVMPAWWIRGRAPHSGRAVIVLHGHGRSRWDSLRRIGQYAQEAALIVTPDLRGHGDAPGRCALARREAGDVCILMAEIEAEYPGIRITLVGHSMGAVVAIHAAAQRAAAGAPIEEVIAWGAYDRVATPLNARLKLRSLPARPFSDAILWMCTRVNGPEHATQKAAALLGTTRLTLHADSLDEVSPLADSQAIAAALPSATLHCSTGVPHSDLGVQ